MIPSTSIHFNTDGTARWVVDEAPHEGLNAIDRPCDNCDGKAVLGIEDYPERPITDCPDCDGTGRHAFTVEAEVSGQMHPDHPWDITKRLRVSVVPGMVVPIFDECPDEKPADHICHAWNGDEWWQHRSFDREDWTERRITLPPDAEPGMWAVLLAVHE